MPPGIRVLYVDGDDEVRDLVSRRLERRGFDVVAVEDRATALDALDGAVDCVVSEYDVPGSDGLAFVDAVRERVPGLPFVLFTGTCEEDAVAEAVRADVTEYLRKGTSDDRIDRLIQRIERAVAETDRPGQGGEAPTGTDSRLRRLHDATRDLMSETDPERIAALTTDAAEEILGLPIATVRFREGEVLELVAATEATVETLGERPPFPIEETLAGTVFEGGEPYVDPDATDVEDPVSPGVVESVAYVPLGEYGVFITAATERDAFDDSDIRLATILAANAEAALDRAHKEEALRRERDGLAALFENVPDPTVETVVREGRPIVQRVNPAFESVFGHASEAIEGENLDEYIVPPGGGSEARAYTERTEDGEGFHGEVRRIADDGLRDFILHVAPHHVDEETVKGYAIYTDITDRKRRERELERQNERLDQFASVVSHDLRNPLSVARGHLELARSSGEAEHFEAVDRAHDRMEGLIEGLLALARRGELADPVEVDLGDVAEDAWATVETGDLSLSLADPPAVTADPERLRQLLENLFRNTAEHGSTSPRSETHEDAVEHGSTSPRSETHEDAVEHEVTATTVTVGALDGGGFYVEDDGVGIPEDEREEVLESGYSGGDGTGFGLAIVETIADAHGWTVSVAEGAAGGARFEFREAPTVDD